jgi:Fe-S cluster assembly protein SufD
MSQVLDQGRAALAGRSDWYLEEFARRSGTHELDGPPWLRELRGRAIAAFGRIGFPTTRHEEWRFTPISPIADTEFVAAEPLHLTPRDLASWTFAGETAAELVFVNGVFMPSLSRLEGLPAGLEVGSLATMLGAGGAALEEVFGRVAGVDDAPFAALNTAFAEDGAYVRVRKHAVIERPVHVLFYSTVSGAPSLSHTRLLVVAEEHSELRLVETYAGASGQRYFTNAVSEFIAGDRALVDHYRLQRESRAAYHVGSMQLRTGRETVFTSHNLALGGLIARNDIGAVLGGEGGDTTLNGLYLADGTQLVDNHTAIDHALPHNGSHEVYKGILGGRARGVFNGKIIVRPDAQKTDAKQTNKALLLSGEAQINTKPQLEIFADDVKCTHGATVGQLDPDMLFYLRARGLGADDARALLIRGFAGDIVNRVKFAPLRDRLEAVLASELPREE